MDQTFKLTQYAKGSGCGCKISPSVLQEVLANHRTQGGQNLLVGNQHNDDAAVYQLNDETALIITADFFTPIVDDAFTFGKIAAANALSDVYAMGGKPITAIALLGWPIDKLPAALASEVIAGARIICETAGIAISGGHTIDAPEPFFGLSVNGITNPKNIKTNQTAKAGDKIYLTKPIGSGILSTAIKRGLITENEQQTFIKTLTQLNDIGYYLGTCPGVHALTDVTGYGLGGHLLEMCTGSGLSARLRLSDIPLLPGVSNYLAQTVLPDATYRNWNAYENNILVQPEVDALKAFALLSDPQTNGGLLVAVGDENEFLSVCEKHQQQVFLIGGLEENGVQSIITIND
ncbi:MAG: selenide, water dikinase SelD [Bacteroidota bacterium]|jgi:selenide,water dikinase